MRFDESVVAQHFAELSTLTGMTQQEFADFERLLPADQALVVEGMRVQVWTRGGASALPRILAILQVLATVAGVVTGVSGAISAVNALRVVL